MELNNCIRGRLLRQICRHRLFHIVDGRISVKPLEGAKLFSVLRLMGPKFDTKMLEQVCQQYCRELQEYAMSPAGAGQGGPAWARVAYRKLQLRKFLYKLKPLPPVLPSGPQLYSRLGSSLWRAAACSKRLSDVHAFTSIAREYNLTQQQIQDAWRDMLSVSRGKCACAWRRGDVALDAHTHTHTSLDHKLQDLQMLYGDNAVIPQDRPFTLEQSRALRLLLQLVQKYKLETNIGDQHGQQAQPNVQGWRDAHKEYLKDKSRVVTLVTLQRRWHELKLSSAERILAHWRRHQAFLTRAAGIRTDEHTDKYDSVPSPTKIHFLIVNSFRHVVTEPLPTWRQLVDTGQVALPEDWEEVLAEDVILVEKEIETIELNDSDKDDDRLTIDDSASAKVTENTDSISMLKELDPDLVETRIVLEPECSVEGDKDENGEASDIKPNVAGSLKSLIQFEDEPNIENDVKPTIDTDISSLDTIKIVNVSTVSTVDMDASTDRNSTDGDSADDMSVDHRSDDSSDEVGDERSDHVDENSISELAKDPKIFMIPQVPLVKIDLTHTWEQHAAHNTIDARLYTHTHEHNTHTDTNNIFPRRDSTKLSDLPQKFSKTNLRIDLESAIDMVLRKYSNLGLSKNFLSIKRNIELLKKCKPLIVRIERLRRIEEKRMHIEEAGRRVRLPDIEEIRRCNSQRLTALVSPTPAASFTAASSSAASGLSRSVIQATLASLTSRCRPPRASAIRASEAITRELSNEMTPSIPALLPSSPPSADSDTSSDGLSIVTSMTSRSVSSFTDRELSNDTNASMTLLPDEKTLLPDEKTFLHAEKTLIPTTSVLSFPTQESSDALSMPPLLPATDVFEEETLQGRKEVLPVTSRDLLTVRERQLDGSRPTPQELDKLLRQIQKEKVAEVRVKKASRYDEASLQLAIHKTMSKELSVSEAARRYNIPPATLLRRIHKINGKYDNNAQPADTNRKKWQRFPRADKQAAIHAIISGHMTLTEAAAHYGIRKQLLCVKTSCWQGDADEDVEKSTEPASDSRQLTQAQRQLERKLLLMTHGKVPDTPEQPETTKKKPKKNKPPRKKKRKSSPPPPSSEEDDDVTGQREWDRQKNLVSQYFQLKTTPVEEKNKPVIARMVYKQGKLSEINTTLVSDGMLRKPRKGCPVLVSPQITSSEVTQLLPHPVERQYNPHTKHDIVKMIKVLKGNLVVGDAKETSKDGTKAKDASASKGNVSQIKETNEDMSIGITATEPKMTQKENSLQNHSEVPKQNLPIREQQQKISLSQTALLQHTPVQPNQPIQDQKQKTEQQSPLLQQDVQQQPPQQQNRSTEETSQQQTIDLQIPLLQHALLQTRSKQQQQQETVTKTPLLQPLLQSVQQQTMQQQTTLQQVPLLQQNLPIKIVQRTSQTPLLQQTVPIQQATVQQVVKRHIVSQTSLRSQAPLLQPTPPRYVVPQQFPRRLLSLQQPIIFVMQQQQDATSVTSLVTSPSGVTMEDEPASQVELCLTKLMPEAKRVHFNQQHNVCTETQETVQALHPSPRSLTSPPSHHSPLVHNKARLLCIDLSLPILTKDGILLVTNSKITITKPSYWTIDDSFFYALRGLIHNNGNSTNVKKTDGRASKNRLKRKAPNIDDCKEKDEDMEVDRLVIDEDTSVEAAHTETHEDDNEMIVDGVGNCENGSNLNSECDNGNKTMISEGNNENKMDLDADDGNKIMNPESDNVNKMSSDGDNGNKTSLVSENGDKMMTSEGDNENNMNLESETADNVLNDSDRSDKLIVDESYSEANENVRDSESAKDNESDEIKDRTSENNEINDENVNLEQKDKDNENKEKSVDTNVTETKSNDSKESSKAKCVGSIKVRSFARISSDCDDNSSNIGTSINANIGPNIVTTTDSNTGSQTPNIMTNVGSHTVTNIGSLYGPIDSSNVGALKGLKFSANIGSVVGVSSRAASPGAGLLTRHGNVYMPLTHNPPVHAQVLSVISSSAGVAEAGAAHVFALETASGRVSAPDASLLINMFAQKQHLDADHAYKAPSTLAALASLVPPPATPPSVIISFPASSHTHAPPPVLAHSEAPPPPRPNPVMMSYTLNNRTRVKTPFLRGDNPTDSSNVFTPNKPSVNIVRMNRPARRTSGPGISLSNVTVTSGGASVGGNSAENAAVSIDLISDDSE